MRCFYHQSWYEVVEIAKQLPRWSKVAFGPRRRDSTGFQSLIHFHLWRAGQGLSAGQSWYDR